MKRRRFLHTTTLISGGVIITPTTLLANNVDLRSLNADMVDEVWLAGALRTFAKYAGLDYLATKVWDYLFDDDTPEPTKKVIKNYNTMMVNGGFTDFSNSNVYINQPTGVVMYGAEKPPESNNPDVCIGVTRHSRDTGDNLMLDGPALGMLAKTAQKLNNPALAKRLMLPSGKIHTGSTGDLYSGYSKPIVYDTQEGYRVGIDYKVHQDWNGKIGKGEIAIVDTNGRSGDSPLVNELFTFPV